MNVKDYQGVKVVELPSRIDALTAKDVEDILNGILSDNNNKLICSFVDTEYISSAGLRVFLSVLKRMAKMKGYFYICCLKPGIIEIFAMAGFVDLFTIFPSEEEAVINIQAITLDIEKQNSEDELKTVLLQVQKERAISTYSGRKLT